MLAACKQDLLSSAFQFSLLFESVRNICLSDSSSVMAIWQPCDMFTENSHILLQLHWYLETFTIFWETNAKLLFYLLTTWLLFSLLLLLFFLLCHHIVSF